MRAAVEGWRYVRISYYFRDSSLEEPYASLTQQPNFEKKKKTVSYVRKTGTQTHRLYLPVLQKYNEIF